MVGEGLPSALVAATFALAVIGAYWAWELGWLYDFQGGIPGLCSQLLEFGYDQSGGIYLTIPLARSRWVAACSQAFEELGAEPRAELEPLLHGPLPPQVLHSEMEVARYFHVDYPVPLQVKELMRRTTSLASPRQELPKGPSAADLDLAVHRSSRTEVGGATSDWWWQSHGKHEGFGGPWREPTIEELAGVGHALREGRLGRFDARKLLPHATFNISVEELMGLHGQAGADVPVICLKHKSKRCRDLVFQFRRWLPIAMLFCPAMPRLSDLRDTFPLPEGTRIQSRRLPRYIDEDQIVRELGLEDEVERAQAQLIAGYANGDVHWDEQDNLFVQLAGVSGLFAVPTEYTDAASGNEQVSSKSSGMTWSTWLASDEFRSRVMPYYYFVLEPGDAVVIPSRTFHAVYGSHDRISFQVFLEPKFNRMRWSAANHSYWFKESPPRRALRNLFFKSIRRLWESDGVGLVLQGGVIEYL